VSRWSNDQTEVLACLGGQWGSRVPSNPSFLEISQISVPQSSQCLTITQLVLHAVLHSYKKSRELNSDDFSNYMPVSVLKLHVWWGKIVPGSVGDTLVHVWVTGGDGRRYLKYHQKSWLFWGNSKSTSDHISVNTGRSEPNEGSIWTSDTFRAQRAHF